MIIEQYYRDNHRVLVKRVRNRLQDWGLSHSEDIVQDAFENAVRYFKLYDDQRDFGAWFNTILNNSLRRYQSAQHSQNTTPLDETFLENMLIDPTLVSHDWITEEEDPEMQQILSMYYNYGFVTRDVSNYLGLSHSNIRKKLERWKKMKADEYGVPKLSRKAGASDCGTVLNSGSTATNVER